MTEPEIEKITCDYCGKTAYCEDVANVVWYTNQAGEKYADIKGIIHVCEECKKAEPRKAESRSDLDMDKVNDALNSETARKLGITTPGHMWKVDPTKNAWQDELRDVIHEAMKKPKRYRDEG